MKATRSSADSKGVFHEVYQGEARKSGVTYARAGGHAFLDVCTLGLWEIIGTPVEGALSNNRGFWVVKASYANPDTETIESMDIFSPEGGKMVAQKKF